MYWIRVRGWGDLTLNPGLGFRGVLLQGLRGSGLWGVELKVTATFGSLSRQMTLPRSNKL